MTDLLVAPAPLAPTTHRGEEAAALLRAFPSRAPATSWPATEEALQDVVERLQEPPLRAAGASAQHQRIYGARVLLAWLESLPGGDCLRPSVTCGDVWCGAVAMVE